MTHDNFLDKALSRDEDTIRDMFSSAARNYDSLNHILSFNRDRGWRKTLVKKSNFKNYVENLLVLDLCTGTGDVIFEFLKRPDFKGKTVGVDFSEPMLSIARERSERMNVTDRATFILSNVLNLPFKNNTFDIVTIAFGLRNLSNLDAGINEIKRVLKPGGCFLSLEFFHPENGVSRLISSWYVNRVVPLVGNMVNRKKGAYYYLPASRQKFLLAEQFDMKLKKSGFTNIFHRHFLFRIATLHRCEKPR